MKSAIFSPRLFRLAAAVLGCALTLAAPPSGRAQDTALPTFLHLFDVSEGDTPGQLVLGSDGNFYGTTAYGGFGYTPVQDFSGDGSVYRITPAGDYETLYAFPGGTQGQSPYDLILGIDGNFYGLTSHGGVLGDGTVFRLTPAGELTTLYDFPDGAAVPGPLVQDGSGNFYGVRSGDNVTTHGSIFRLTPAGEYTTLYTFTGGSDGGNSSGLTEGSDGNFYGTSYQGTGGTATIYRITPTGGFTVLHPFTEADDIFSPNGLTLGSDGNLYGTTAYGGVNMKGLVFRLTLAGDYTVLYAFTGGSDGEYPGGRLVEGSDGNFYGITGGTTEPMYQPARRTANVAPIPGVIIAPPPMPSTVFRITSQGVLTSLYASTSPFTGFVLGNDGNFYGVDVDDGAGVGSVFKLSIVSQPAFFTNQAPLADGTYYLSFSNGNYFGYYTFQSDPNYLYHLDLGPEYFIDAKDGQAGLYLYDFRSGGFFYTSPTFSFPYLYDFSLQSVVYLFPDPDNAGRYNSMADGQRYFYDFNTGTTILK